MIDCPSGGVPLLHRLPDRTVSESHHALVHVDPFGETFVRNQLIQVVRYSDIAIFDLLVWAVSEVCSLALSTQQEAHDVADFPRQSRRLAAAA
jgi:hypothetical protein